MIPLLTSAEARALDEGAEQRGTPVDVLMDRAGLAVAVAAVRLAGGAYGRRAVIICGKGNNGGDGLVAARHLARWGMAVECLLLTDLAALTPPVDGKAAALAWAGVRPRPFGPTAAARTLARADVAIDAVFGTGFRGEPEGAASEAIAALTRSPAPILAVDVPSGVEGDTGAIRGSAVSADMTVTFGAPKVGNVLAPGGEHAGVLEVVDIGLPLELVRPELAMLEPPDVRAWLPTRAAGAHKRASGVVLVVAGSRWMTGAPRLVAEGAIRAGAGLVTVAVPEPVLATVQGSAVEPTFLSLPATAHGSIAEAAWEVLAPELDRFDAVAVGPGLSTEAETLAFVRRLVAESPAPVVADADAVNAFAGRAAELTGRKVAGVITPHAGEFARLFEMPGPELEDDRVGFVRKAASETAGVVLLKGRHTLVARPDGLVWLNPTGSPALATGGTGDVLTGVIAALVARGLGVAEAAAAGAYVHGLAGELAGSRLGEGTSATDVARAIPLAVRQVREVA